jgi:hypothetical protein
MHVPKSRLSMDVLGNVLHALVLKFEDVRPQTIVRSYLNERGKILQYTNSCTSHPEAGVLRHYCGTNTTAWADQMIVPAKFRKVKKAGKRDDDE